jgi:hypothetical protein
MIGGWAIEADLACDILAQRRWMQGAIRCAPYGHHRSGGSSARVVAGRIRVGRRRAAAGRGKNALRNAARGRGHRENGKPGHRADRRALGETRGKSRIPLTLLITGGPAVGHLGRNHLRHCGHHREAGRRGGKHREHDNEDDTPTCHGPHARSIAPGLHVGKRRMIGAWVVPLPRADKERAHFYAPGCFERRRESCG